MKKPKSTTATIVAVAREVLNLIDFMSVKTSNGYMVTRRGRDGPDLYEFNRARILQFEGDPKAIQENIPKIAKSCEVCALGAMFLAHTHLYDGVDYLTCYYNETAENRSTEFLGDYGYAIEQAFENPSDPKLQKLKPKARLKVIMLQIIRQKGKFKENMPKCKNT